MGCPASTKLMRRSRSGQTTTLVGANSVLLVPFDEWRVALVISSPASGVLYLALRKAASNQGGIILNALSPPLVMHIGDHGALVQGPLFALNDGAAENVTFWDSSVAVPLE